MTMGISASLLSARIRRSSSRPSMPGSITSSTTSSGRCVRSASQKLVPSSKPSASKPVERRAYTSISRMLASSSTHQIMLHPSLCSPVTEKMTHSAMFVAWSPMRSKYLAIIKRSSANSPSEGSFAMRSMSARFTRAK